MKIVTGRVVAGKVVVEGDPLDEGSIVTILAPETETDFELAPEDEAELLASMEEARRGQVVDAQQVLRRLAGKG